MIFSMAKTTVVTDDLDGKADAQTVYFSVDGTEYWLDLTDQNREKLKNALTPFTDAAHELGNSRKARPVGTRAKVEAKIIRSWGNKHGFITERGPLPKDLIAAYNEQFGTPSDGHG